jgi:futalosine hydrolase
LWTTTWNNRPVRILVVAATDAEVSVMVRKLGRVRQQRERLAEYVCADRAVHVLTTGVGMVATAAWCSRELSRSRYDLALDVGLCGSFEPRLAPGTVVHVVSDCVAELGAEDGDRFVSLEELGLDDRLDVRLGGAELRNPAPPAIGGLERLPQARGITVNTVHGHERSIAAIVERLHPQVESMEGAAFMYACLMHDVPFAQIRAVSNVVERRDRGAWKVQEAIDALGEAAYEVVTAS